MLTMINFGIQCSYYFAFLTMLIIPFFFCTFLWFEEVRLDHAQFNNIFKLDNIREDDGSFAEDLPQVLDPTQGID